MLPSTTFDLSAKLQRTLLRQQQDKLSPARIAPVIGRAIANKLKLHLGALNQSRANKLGGKRSNFYAACRRSVSQETTPDGVTISVSHIGYAQRYFGGVIRPVKAKYLTIPVDSRAYGKDPRKLPLFFAVGRSGKPFLAYKKKRREGGPLRAAFVLRKSVRQKPDPSVFLSEKEIHATVDETVFKRLESRQ